MPGLDLNRSWWIYWFGNGFQRTYRKRKWYYKTTGIKLYLDPSTPGKMCL